MMKETDIRKYAGLMQELGLTGLEITEDNKVVRLERTMAAAVGYSGSGTAAAAADVSGGYGNVPAGMQADASVNTAAVDTVLVKSPIVGVFYAAPAENAAPYVSIGDSVEKGDTLCMIEAMKLLNEVNAEESGVVMEISVTNGQVVEYGTPLFRIRRNA